MKFKVTLKQLREHKACVEGYNKVVCSLKNVPYVERNTYIRFKHTEAIPLLSIIESNGLDDALWCLRCNDSEWSRDSRLFAVWCARQVQHLMNDKRSLKALDVAEAFANNNSTSQELAAAWPAAMDAAWDATRDATRAAARAAAWAADMDATRAATRDAAWAAALAAAWAATRDAARDATRDATRDAQKEMFIKMCNGEAPWQVV